ncbi:(E)-4-hydroxy-3-methylbut-2-enyl diphosphate reductase [Streptomyces sp. NBRC 110611]|uniref:hypothetical protein n=1 Tax=Streptomyces sp. NBRC 110611 TaxID=1621259 RepID=UPI0008325B61|nr:hypothetical protein [Streptomyces sp. NBRC 110611]GAU69125.1 (E)-4-hydroxy-3-methylbut-2-enyl diphosphate reductase [Streptomyces sp. NBRC 110611]
MAPQDTEPDWCLEDVTVTVHSGTARHEFTALRLDGRGEGRLIWLNEAYGTVVHLRRTAGHGEGARPGVPRLHDHPEADVWPDQASPHRAGMQRSTP